MPTTTEAAVAELVEVMAVTHAGAGHVEPGVTECTAAAIAEQLSVDNELGHNMVGVESEPGWQRRRAALGETSKGTDTLSGTRSTKVPAHAEGVTNEASEAAQELLEPPALDLLTEWAGLMFTDPEGKLVELPALMVTFLSTNGLVLNAKEVVRLLFEKRRKDICSSPERPDLKLSQEEALGWLLAFTMGRPLLDEEARPIGKVAATQASVAKQLRDGVRDSAKAQRGKARKRSATAEEIADIDAKAAVARDSIDHTTFSIKHIPPKNSRVVERRAPSVPAPPPEAVEEAVCPRGHALLQMTQSQVVTDAAAAAFRLLAFEDRDQDDLICEETEVAKVRWKHALRRLAAAHGEIAPWFTEWGVDSGGQMVDWVFQQAENEKTRVALPADVFGIVREWGQRPPAWARDRFE
jgi:hypothetical protein